jgi:hypothetical protein
MLREAWNHLAAKGETAPGPNGQPLICAKGRQRRGWVSSSARAMRASPCRSPTGPGGDWRST